MEIKVRTIFSIGILYLYLAVVVFFTGWLKPFYAFTACVVMLIGIGFGIRQWTRGEERKVFISKPVIVLSAVFVLFMCWQTGIGAFTGQAGDWHKHNAILHDLVEKAWPVIYQTEYGESMLSYYIGYYLLPAACGKLFHSFRMAEIVQYLVSAIGIYLLWLIVVNVCRAETARRQMICLGLIFLFGGMMVFGQAVCGNLYPENFPYGNMEWMNPETVKIQYSPNWSLLKWVSAQTIAPWVATAILLLKPDKVETYVMIGIPIILYSGFAMVGLGIMMFALCGYYVFGKKGKNLKNIFSISNLLLAFVVGSILILYFIGNLMGEKPEYMAFHLLNYGQKKMFYFIFCFFMFGYYALLIFKENRRNGLYWITTAALCIYPLFSMGLQNDFTMRTSIPALFSLLILVLCFLFREEEGQIEGRSLMVRKTLLAAGLIAGMVYPVLNLREGVMKNKIGEIYRTDEYLTLEQYANPADAEIADDLKYNYYSYDLENDIFYQYLAK